jgi:hypothetical protein
MLFSPHGAANVQALIFYNEFVIDNILNKDEIKLMRVVE